MSDRVSRRNPRLRLACSRCQRRKIRCDGQFPSCNNCRKASVTCTDGASSRLQGITSDSSATTLQRRIEWLESIIRQRLPDVDLSCGPPKTTILDEDNGSYPQSASTTALDETVAENFSGQSLAAAPASNSSTHEIGMVSVANNSDQRYVGPSSGYFLARMLLSTKSGSVNQSTSRDKIDTDNALPTLVKDLVQTIQGPLELPNRTLAARLSQSYFEVLHPQYPVLYEPYFLQNLERIYNDEQRDDMVDPCSMFQAYMVFALGSVILSRRSKHVLPSESYCLSALEYFHKLNVENSLPGLQCLLLLSIFTIHSPNMRLNIWYLNYQCIAALLDLGLQRDIRTDAGISLLAQELRTRVFWVVFTLDRTIATMMGRPIGLRDEACELRLPQNFEDHSLELSNLSPSGSQPTTSMDFAIHFFKLARLNSEIKYVANSIVRDVPSYAYPTITNINEWQHRILQKLDDWAATIPKTDGQQGYMQLICEIRHLSIRMLLLRPSPAIPKPSTTSLVECYEVACSSIHKFDHLYRRDLLVHSWVTFHDLISTTVTMLYCVRAVPEVFQRTEVDVLMNNLAISLSILSATGEHWAAAKRCRYILNDLGTTTIQWLKNIHRTGVSSSTLQVIVTSESGENLMVPIPTDTFSDAITPGVDDQVTPIPDIQTSDPLELGANCNIPSASNVWNDQMPDPFACDETTNLDSILRNLFDDFIPHSNDDLFSWYN